MPKAACKASTLWSNHWAIARPAWKVLRVLANLLELPGFNYESSQDVLHRWRSGAAITAFAPAALLSNVTKTALQRSLLRKQQTPWLLAFINWTASCGVRTSLQLTADARSGT